MASSGKCHWEAMFDCVVLRCFWVTGSRSFFQLNCCQFPAEFHGQTVKTRVGESKVFYRQVYSECTIRKPVQRGGLGPGQAASAKAVYLELLCWPFLLCLFNNSKNIVLTLLNCIVHFLLSKTKHHKNEFSVYVSFYRWAKSCTGFIKSVSSHGGATIKLKPKTWK